MSREIIDHLRVIALMANQLYIVACDGKSVEVGRAERDRIGDSLKEIERLLAARSQEAYDEMERVEKCGHLFANIQPNGCLVCRLLADEREKYLEILCASVCSFCADGEKFDLHGDKQGYWCHTEKGVSPTWQNQRCVAMGFREVSRQLDLTAPSSTEEE